jgi:hypothetical protein
VVALSSFIFHDQIADKLSLFIAKHLYHFKILQISAFTLTETLQTHQRDRAS